MLKSLVERNEKDATAGDSGGDSRPALKNIPTESGGPEEDHQETSACVIGSPLYGVIVVAGPRCPPNEQEYVQNTNVHLVWTRKYRG